MIFNWLKTFFLMVIAFFCFADESAAQDEKEHIEVAMRLIGHQILLNSGDSSSRVLPIENDGDKFRIRFESEFQFVPNTFSASIDSIVQLTKLAKSFRVEVEHDETKQVVYSYELISSDSIIAPCEGRSFPRAKYSILFTILEEYNLADLANASAPNKTSSNALLFGSILVVILVLIVLGFYFWKKRSSKNINSDLVKIGKYRFDERNMKLILKKESIDLTSKEADLIALLHSSINVTLERDVILKAVWEDDGDYVGRTLDVFISKLRKKFAEDSTVKIVNIRGVGYKLMLDTSKAQNA